MHKENTNIDLVLNLALHLHEVLKKSKTRGQNQSERCGHPLGAKYFLVLGHGIIFLQ